MLAHVVSHITSGIDAMLVTSKEYVKYDAILAGLLHSTWGAHHPHIHPVMHVSSEEGKDVVHESTHDS